MREAQTLHGHSTEALVRYAEAGWREDVSASAWTGPGGPLSLAQFYALRTIDGVVSLHEPLARRLGVPPPVALFAMLLVAVIASTAVALVGSMWLAPARRRPAVAMTPQPPAPPAEAGRPHAD